MLNSWKIPENLGSKFELNDGKLIPSFGLGLYKASVGDNKGTETAVTTALKEGYRLVDTAEVYGNEAEVGSGIKQSNIKREDIYVVTKTLKKGYDECLKAFEQSNERLGLDYVDLYLMHAPIGGKILKTYDAMLKLREKGVVKSIGVSNFNISMLEGLRKSGRPTPAVNQVELHPYMRRQELVTYCRKHGILLMAFSPITKGKKLGEPEVISIAEKYKKTVAQLFIRWCVQSGFLVIPKSSKKERIIENCQVFDWSISDEDMNKLCSLPESTCYGLGTNLYQIHEMNWEESR